MTFKAIPNQQNIRWVDISIHQTCLIVHIKGKNTLYEFKEADTLATDMSKFLNVDDITNMKEWIELNCSKVKFTKKSNPPEQLSLF